MSPGYGHPLRAAFGSAPDSAQSLAPEGVLCRAPRAPRRKAPGAAVTSVPGHGEIVASSSADPSELRYRIPVADPGSVDITTKITQDSSTEAKRRAVHARPAISDFETKTRQPFGRLPTAGTPACDFFPICASGFRGRSESTLYCVTGYGQPGRLNPRMAV